MILDARAAVFLTTGFRGLIVGLASARKFSHSLSACPPAPVAAPAADAT